MLLPYYITLSILELSIIFFVLHDGVTMTVKCVTFLSHFVTCVTVTYDVIPLLLSKFEIKKEKRKLKIK